MKAGICGFGAVFGLVLNSLLVSLMAPESWGHPGSGIVVDGEGGSILRIQGRVFGESIHRGA